MKLSVGEIRKIIAEELKQHHFGGSFPEENYESELLDDPDFEKSSVYVPDDIKKSIKKWAVDMGLSTTRGKK